MAAASPLSEALAAGVGGVVSTLILYPVELIKNKMQATVIFHKKKLSSSGEEGEGGGKEGEEGEEGKLSNGQTKKKKKKKKKKRQSTLDSFRAFDKHTERAVQLASSSPTNFESTEFTATAPPASFLDTVRDVQRTKGLAGFYIGAQASAAHAFCEKFFYFWSYSFLKLFFASSSTNSRYSSSVIIRENGDGVMVRRKDAPHTTQIMFVLSSSSSYIMEIDVG